MAGHILAMGGGALIHPDSRLDELMLELAGPRRPRVSYVGTASAHLPERVEQFYEAFGGRPCEPSHLELFGMPDDPAAHVARQDVIYVGGGNTANLLAIWRVHGMDEALRAAWEQGVVLCGGSAGMICWFEAGLTDSFGPQLEGMRDGLGFLPGSACPHYDGEELRRPRYRELVDGGFPAGWAAEDGVGLHFEGAELVEVVSALPGKRAYRVEPGSETPHDAREL